MNSQSGSKINYLLKKWPQGTVAVSEWLKEQGVYRQLAESYVKGSWLDRLGHGAFIRAGEKVNWTGALYAIQQQLHLSIHPAGKTALSMLSRAHYLNLGPKEKGVLFGSEGEKLPAWFRKRDWGVKIRYATTNLFSHEKLLGLTDSEEGGYLVKISSAERAILEVCYDVPDQESFEEAELLMEGLLNLRPKLVQTLLEACRSVKAKRLFMYLAEKHNHAWAKRLILENINLGTGKRALCKNGKYESKYQLVVPLRKKGVA